jgi:hypothetical protein
VRCEGRKEEGTKWAWRHRATPLLNDAQKTEEGGGPAVRTPRGVERAWGLALIGGWRPDRAPADRGPPRRTRATRSVLGRRAPGAADAWAPAGSGRGREERGTGNAWANPGEETERVEPR